MSKQSVTPSAAQLHQRLTTLLELLPPSVGMRATRAALLRSADVSLARNDVAGLTKLHRELTLLVESLRHAEVPAEIPDTPAPPTRRAHAGPGLPGWGRSARRTTPWRREHAPIQYPYGDPPTGWDTRLHDSTTSIPDSNSSADSLARLQAYRRHRAMMQDAERELHCTHPHHDIV